MSLALFFGSEFSRVSGAEDSLSLSAESYVLYCADSKQVLLSCDMDKVLPMASTTKIMTSLLCLEYAEKNDKYIEFQDSMISEGSSMYLKSGEVLRLSDLAAGMMMVSGNDAANATAISISGSIEAFALLMNERAKQIGMKHTNFRNPSGLPETDHYSTAYDLALLMAEALDNEEFSRLNAMKSVTVDFIKPQSQSVTYNNHNKLLSMYEYCTGGKTGYTKEAGRCLVTCAEKDGLRLVAVTMNDRNDWQDHISLYEYGFENFAAVGVEETESFYPLRVLGGENESVTAFVKDKDKCILPADKSKNVKVQVMLPAFVFAPVKKGERVGKVIWLFDDEIIMEKDLVANEDSRYVRVSLLKRIFHRFFL